MSNENFENRNRKDMQSEEKNLDSAQNNQNKVGDAAADPETTGPAENLREKAAEMNDSGEDKSREPA
jgi:hypothetical protein